MAFQVSVDEYQFQMGAQVGHQQTIDVVDQFESMDSELQAVFLQHRQRETTRIAFNSKYY